MDYRVTFEDGSEALAHYGIKGMKWGVWNEETKARYGESKSVAKSRKRYEKALAQRNRKYQVREVI